MIFGRGFDSRRLHQTRTAARRFFVEAEQEPWQKFEGDRFCHFHILFGGFTGLTAAGWR